MVGEIGGFTNEIRLGGALQMGSQHKGRGSLGLKVTVERSHCWVCIMVRNNTTEWVLHCERLKDLLMLAVHLRLYVLL